MTDDRVEIWIMFKWSSLGGSGQVKRRRQREQKDRDEEAKQGKLVRMKVGGWGELSEQSELPNLHHSHESILQTHTNEPIFLLHCSGKVACPAPSPLRLSMIVVIPQWAELINKFGFDCIRGSPHHELVCIHTHTLVDVTNTR